MLLYQLGLLALLLPVCSFAPGFFFVRKLRWNPLEKLTGSIGLSLILVYLAAWGIYCMGARGNGMPVHPLPFVVVSLLCAAMAAVCWKDIGRLLRAAPVRQALAGFGFLLLWAAVLTAIVRNFSGGTWFGDWLEHFQRSLFFLRHFPAGITDFPGLCPAGPAAHDERAGGVFPGANRRPLRDLPGRFRLSQRAALPALLPVDAGARQAGQAAHLAAGATVRLKPAGDAKHNLYLDQGVGGLLRRGGPLVLPGRMAEA